MTAEMDMHDKKFIKISQNDKDNYLDQGSGKLGILYIFWCFYYVVLDLYDKYVLSL